MKGFLLQINVFFSPPFPILKYTKSPKFLKRVVTFKILHSCLYFLMIKLKTTTKKAKSIVKRLANLFTYLFTTACRKSSSTHGQHLESTSFQALQVVFECLSVCQEPLNVGRTQQYFHGGARGYGYTRGLIPKFIGGGSYRNIRFS